MTATDEESSDLGTPPRRAPQHAPRPRDPYFDNAKMALVTLVVVGHAWTLLPTDDQTQQWAYDWLYFWHVPAFVVVTGYLSKSFTWSRSRLSSLVTTVAVPYVVFEGVIAAFRHYVGGVELKDLWTDPHWPMWYLSALFFWRLMTPVLVRLPAKVVAAVAISLVAGLYAGDTFDFARVFGLLPFFVLGLKLEPGHWDLLRTPRLRWWGAGVLVAILVAARFTDSVIETEWLYYRSRYDALDPNDLRAAVIRLSLLLIGTAGAMAFLTLVPRGRSWFSTLGAASLVVYLFHGFFVLSANFAGADDWAAAHFWVAFPLFTLLAVAVALLLAAPPVARRLNVAVDPVGAWRRRRRGRVPTSG